MIVNGDEVFDISVIKIGGKFLVLCEIDGDYQEINPEFTPVEIRYTENFLSVSFYYNTDKGKESFSSNEVSNISISSGLIDFRLNTNPDNICIPLEVIIESIHIF